MVFYIVSQFKRLFSDHALFCLLLIFGLGVGVSYAATPAGTVIKNQASASYRDADGVLRYATSNIVETLIQQVAAVQLTQDQSRPVVAGRQIFLSHAVTNVGNGVDTFNLSVQNSVADDFDFTGLDIYADTDQNGLPDVYVPVSSTPELSMLETWSFVVAVQVPAGTPATDSAAVEVEAVSEFDQMAVATNVDTAIVEDGAVVEVYKSINISSGNSPSGPITLTLSYRNVGTVDAVSLALIDALPDGMEYVAGSAIWSGTGNQSLSDDGSSGPVGGNPAISYCSYSTLCGGLPEANSDIDSDSINQVTAIISTVAPGASGVVSFDVNIAEGLSASTLANTAEFEYTSNAVVSPRQTTNTVAFNVLHEPAVVLNGSEGDMNDGADEPAVVSAIAQGTAVVFRDIVWNAGNDTDTFDLTFDRVSSTFPSGTVYRFLQSDGMTPLLDSNGNGIPDTGPIPAGASYPVVLQVIPPAEASGNNSGNGYEVAVVATSVADTAASNLMINRLLNISLASVDITNTAAIPDGDASGVGVGPEATPVSVFSATPGSTVIIDLYVNNTGQTPMSLDLSASTEPDFSGIVLPDGWVVEFRLAGDDTSVTNTLIINAGEYTLVHALVTLPADAEAGDVSVYFRALSEQTGAIDIKHDQIAVSAIQQVLLELDQSGQTSAGGSYLYNHTLRNIGNTSISNVSLVSSDNVSGWNSIVYEDSNNNGSLDASDQVVSSVAPLDAGDVKTIFVKVFAPTGAATLTTNQTTLVASWGGANFAQNVDTTVVADIEINIVKEQAPDYGCTGVTDGVYGVGGFSVEPGNNCVSYRLTATNAGQATAFNVEIADATPAFTAYFGNAFCSHGSCTVQEPSVGGQGNVIASIPALSAGDVVMLNFSVRVE